VTYRSRSRHAGGTERDLTRQLGERLDHLLQRLCPGLEETEVLVSTRHRLSDVAAAAGKVAHVDAIMMHAVEVTIGTRRSDAGRTCNSDCSRSREKQAFHRSFRLGHAVGMEEAIDRHVEHRPCQPDEACEQHPEQNCLKLPDQRITLTSSQTRTRRAPQRSIALVGS
jgi:hypothetical protein